VDAWSGDAGYAGIHFAPVFLDRSDATICDLGSEKIASQSIASLSITTANVGVTIPSMTVTPNAGITFDGVNHKLAFALTACTAHVLEQTISTSSGGSLSSITFVRSGRYLICFSYDAGTTWTAQPLDLHIDVSGTCMRFFFCLVCLCVHHYPFVIMLYSVASFAELRLITFPCLDLICL
jgi:hypothetical protein